jgi:peroxiredoxin
MKKILLLACTLLSLFMAKSQTSTLPTGLKVGDNAPPIIGKDNMGVAFNMKKQLKKGDVVLVFYRGQWCPYCNKQLSAFNDSLGLIAAKGATVVAVSPETLENVTKTVSKTKATFSILSDSAMATMQGYKVNFAVDEKTIAKYKTYGIDFTVANGENGANLPVPATYIIGKNGKIKYAFFNSDYRLRPSVKEILAYL